MLKASLIILGRYVWAKTNAGLESKIPTFIQGSWRAWLIYTHFCGGKMYIYMTFFNKWLNNRCLWYLALQSVDNEGIVGISCDWGGLLKTEGIFSYEEV